MRLLLDTQSWLWFVLGDDSISASARSYIADPQNEKLISPASFWELAIKISIKKYYLPQPFDRFIEEAIYQQGFNILPILPVYTNLVCSLPFHHRDPFDRMIVAQAIAEQLPVVSSDSTFDLYGLNRLW